MSDGFVMRRIKTRGMIPCALFWSCVGLLVVLGCGFMASCGDARPIRSADAMATRAYLNARSELDRATAAALPRVSGSGEAFVATIARECPAAAKMARHDAGFDVMSIEATRASAAVMRQANRAAIRQFDHTVAGLRWSDPQLTLLVHGLAIREDAAVNVGVPDLCGELKRWSRSGYRTVPASTERYNSHIAAVVGIEGRIMEAAADWWQKPLPANERRICRHFHHGRHRRESFTVCSGGPPGPTVAAREHRVIEESESIGEAVWKLLALYEDGSTRSLAQRVERHDARLQAGLRQTFFSLGSRLSQSVGFETLLLSTELTLLGLPGAK
jgi:hypothetical protein